MYSLSGQHFIEFGNHLQRLLARTDVAFVGCCHKADLTKLRKDYTAMNLPVVENTRIIDGRDVTISRGLAKRGLGLTTLADLCQKGCYYFLKDSDIRVGNLFACKNGSLRNHGDALSSCHRDAEAPLLLYNLWREMPILTKQLTSIQVFLLT